LWREGFETSWDGMAMTRRATAHRLPLTEEPGWGWGASHVFHDAGRRPAPPRDCTMRAGGPRPRGIARCGPEARAPAGSHDAGRRLAPPRDCTMRAGGSRPRGIARCGPEARAPTGSHDAGRRLAPTGSHDAGRRLAPPRGCTMRAGGPRPHGVARCGPEARAPTGVHGSGVIGSRCAMFVGGTPLVYYSISEESYLT